MLVKDAIYTCNTGQIDGLSQQLLERLLNKDYLVKVDHPLIICQGRHNNPYLRPLAYRALVRAVESLNQKIVINSCLRTIMQQYMLREQYLAQICGITAAAIPGRSNHQSGRAIDVADWLYWRSPLIKYGWKWLGSWDRWHFDYQYEDLDLGKIQIKEWQQLYNEHNPDNKLKVDGIWGANTAASVADSPAAGFKQLPVFKRGDINRDVGKIQILLRDALNLTSSQFKADCAYGAETVKAVMAFQRLNSLPITGECDRATLDKLAFYG